MLEYLVIYFTVPSRFGLWVEYVLQNYYQKLPKKSKSSGWFKLFFEENI